MPRVEPGKSFGGTMELAVFGRMRNETDRRVELTRRRFAAFAAPGGPWEVKDVSQTGFRLLAPMSVANMVTLGTLAAIRPHGQTPWALGIVRRMKRMTADRDEIGLQVIANTLIGVDLVEQRKSDDAAYSVDGEATTINGRTFHGLFLALRKREGEPAVQSLIVPAAEYQPAQAAEASSRRARPSTRSASGACSSSSRTGCGPRSSRSTSAAPVPRDRRPALRTRPRRARTAIA